MAILILLLFAGVTVAATPRINIKTGEGSCSSSAKTCSDLTLYHDGFCAALSGYVCETNSEQAVREAKNLYNQTVNIAVLAEDDRFALRLVICENYVEACEFDTEISICLESCKTLQRAAPELFAPGVCDPLPSNGCIDAYTGKFVDPNWLAALVGFFLTVAMIVACCCCVCCCIRSYRKRQQRHHRVVPGPRVIQPAGGHQQMRMVMVQPQQMQQMGGQQIMIMTPNGPVPYQGQPMQMGMPMQQPVQMGTPVQGQNFGQQPVPVATAVEVPGKGQVPLL